MIIVHDNSSHSHTLWVIDLVIGLVPDSCNLVKSALLFWIVFGIFNKCLNSKQTDSLILKCSVNKRVIIFQENIKILLMGRCFSNWFIIATPSIIRPHLQPIAALCKLILVLLICTVLYTTYHCFNFSS